MFDCIIVGGGPAGLISATYLGRFRRRVLVIDGGTSRAALIPISHNFPAWPDGVSGEKMLELMRVQAERYGADIQQGVVKCINKEAEGFSVSTESATHRAKTILVATGVIDIEPNLPDLKNAIRQGYVRHCPICDGYEVIDQKIAVMGVGKKGLREALFLRTFSKDISLLTLGGDLAMDNIELELAKRAGIQIIEEPISQVYIEKDRIAALRMYSGKQHRFDTLYSALGTVFRSQLAVEAGAQCNDESGLVVDSHQETSVNGMFAAGDVISTLHQISVAAGQAAIAAVSIHNRLREAQQRGVIAS